MKHPNGYGSVYKLSGKRRKPWGVRKTIGWDEKGKQLYQNIGYYETRTDAMLALAEFNKNPYTMESSSITFAEVFEKWSKKKFAKTSQSSINGYNASYKIAKNIHSMRFVDIKKDHLQAVMDSCTKGHGTKRKIKVLFNQLFKYALENDLVNKDYSKFVELGEKTEVSARTRFSNAEIKKLWENVERNEYVQVYIILIYTGLRISELLDLKKEHVYLDERSFDVVDSKTEAGIRKVPIAQKIYDYFVYWMNKNDCDYLISTPDGEHFKYRNYYDSYWKPFMEEMKMNHRPHDTRHTTVSLLASANVNQTIIKKIVGHKGSMSLTEKVYTHFEIQELIDAIDKI
ncbi:tyrosine-type recombinase/integrase [Chryseomicrobium palamuruense]|uniref:Tyrosine-type recombinase/integrase n=1 Tax=Chryseomicrobium palamuruense TaxID=682973 RepID=A0ABV8UX06_9BACL